MSEEKKYEEEYGLSENKVRSMFRIPAENPISEKHFKLASCIRWCSQSPEVLAKDDVEIATIWEDIKKRMRISPHKLIRVINDSDYVFDDYHTSTKKFKEIDYILECRRPMGWAYYERYIPGMKQELLTAKWSDKKVGFREEKLWTLLAYNGSIDDELLNKFLERPTRPALYAYVLYYSDKDPYLYKNSDKHIRKFAIGRMQIRGFDGVLNGVSVMKEIQARLKAKEISEDVYIKYAVEVLHYYTNKYNFNVLNAEQKDEAYEDYRKTIILASGNFRIVDQKLPISVEGTTAYYNSAKLQKMHKKAIDKYNALYQVEKLNSLRKTLRMRTLRTIAKDNVSPEKGVINPKRSAQEKKNIKLMLDSISKGIND